MSYFCTAQICLNGHCIVSDLESNQVKAESHCSKCGAETISNCPVCHAPIRGDFVEDGIATISRYEVPSFCYSCGTAYPWILSSMKSTALIIQEDGLLDEAFRQTLVSSLPDVVSETPRSVLAVTRLKRALSSAGKFTADAIRQFVIDFGCELVKHHLGI